MNARAATRPAIRNRIDRSGLALVAEIVENPKNWRTHPAEQRRALAGSLDSVGWVQQVIINTRTGQLVDGHARVQEAAARGEETVPALYVDLSPEEEELVLATLDPIAAMATVDQDKLEALLDSVSIDDAGLARLLRGMRGPRKGLTDPDFVPEPTGVPRVQPGELYRLGDHRLLVGDALDPAAVARLLDGAEPTLLATDPPYGIRLDASVGPRRNAVGRTAGHRNVSLAGDDRIDWSEAFELVPSLLVAYVWHNALSAPVVLAGLERIGFEPVQQIVWDKGEFTFGRSWYQWAHEVCLAARRPGGRILDRPRNQATVWHMAAVDSGEAVHPATCCLHQSDVWAARSPKKTGGAPGEVTVDHPTQKPVVTAQIPIANHLAEGEAVYEPFAGSGTTLIAAETLGRVALAMEIEPRFAQLTIERWEAFTGERAELVP